ncbi:hydantoinase/oxoprolinase family protein [Methanopyrus sp. SNP6]|uniref:hydantoinase/oxoprolinase family protein n=1 Tax=Methanopyrus sp. SNP6 TaxID=1937005 RepID=UPI0011E60257|nr:hydantoinase/oxoprolinase family protein [Methanopyrus sp. SNP6]
MRILGLDTGSTHVDAVVLEDGEVEDRVKVPRDGKLLEPIRRALRTLDADERRVSTTLPINALTRGRTDPVHLVLIPGPGLDPDPLLDLADRTDVLPGYVDHRGEVVEEPDPDAVEPPERGYALAVVAKYSHRNADLERKIIEAHRNAYVETIPGYHLPYGNFPRRVATAVLGARVKRITRRFLEALGRVDGVLRGDGGLQTPEEALRVPVNVLHSGPAAGVLGAAYLTGLDDFLLADVGGATIDITKARDGRPAIEEGAELFGYLTAVRAANVRSLPYGGNVVLTGERITDDTATPACYGGSEPTLTDALVVAGYHDPEPDGDPCKSRRVLRELGDPHEVAEDTLETLRRELLRRFETYDGPVLWAGALAPALRELTGVGEVVPYHDVCNAVGCAVARRAREAVVYVHTERGYGHVAPAGEKFEVDRGRVYSREELAELATEAAGFEPDEIRVRAFEIVRGGVRVGQWAEVYLYRTPGVEPPSPG